MSFNRSDAYFIDHLSEAFNSRYYFTEKIENLFTQIPFEILNFIQEKLFLYDLITLARTNKALLQFCISNVVIGPRLKKDFPKAFFGLKDELNPDYYQAYIKAVEYEYGYGSADKDMMYGCKRNNQTVVRNFLKMGGYALALATREDEKGFPPTYWLNRRSDQVFCDEIWKYIEGGEGREYSKKDEQLILNAAIQLNQSIETILAFSHQHEMESFKSTNPTHVKLFMLAIMHNHLEMVKIFLTCQFNPYRGLREKPVHVSGNSDDDTIENDSFKPEKEYPLLTGIYANQLDAVKLILEYQLDIHHTFGPNGNTALHYAAQWGRTKIAKKLLKLGASLSLLNKQNETPVYVAAAAGRYSVIRLFFKVNSKLVLELCSDYRFNIIVSPLYAALFNGHGDIAAYFVDNNANIKELIAKSPFLLSHCIEKNYVECVALLLKNGAKPVLRKDVYPHPVLYHVAELGYVDIFNLLVRYGEKIAESDNQGKFCLYAAVENKHVDMVKELIARHDVDVNQTFAGLTYLHVALKSKEKYDGVTSKPKDIAMVLLEGMANPWPLLPLEDNDGSGAIHLACDRGYKKCVKKMLDDYPALIHQENGWGETPIFSAIAKKRYEIVSELLNRGARLDVISRYPDRLGYTPLHLAAETNNTLIIDLLVKAGVNPNIKTKDNKLPLDLVASLDAQITLARYVSSRNTLFSKTTTASISTEKGIGFVNQ